MRFIFFTILFALAGAAVGADHNQVLTAVERNAATLHQQTSTVPLAERPRVVRRLQNVINTLQDAIYDLEHGGPAPAGGWYPLNGHECYQYCANLGLAAGVSPDGASCVSGENRAASAFGKVNFVHGCFGGCSPEPYSNASSFGQFCYKPGQKKDNDRTDITVGCFCR